MAEARQAVRDRRVIGIGFGSQLDGLVALDGAGKPLRPALIGAGLHPSVAAGCRAMASPAVDPIQPDESRHSLYVQAHAVYRELYKALKQLFTWQCKMPEGDTIWRTAAELRTALAGKQVKRARPDGLRRLVGATVTSVEPIGKHLVISFDNGYALHSHMRMRGAWHVYRPAQKWSRPEWQLKAGIETEDTVAVCFGAPVVELIRNVAERTGHLGPDILADAWDPAEVIRRARQVNLTAVGEMLLDQRVTAGIGNVYRCESLWHERINPWTKTQQLTDEQLSALFGTARAAMRANVTTNTYRRSFPGYGPGAVHGRGGRPCPRCGTPVQVRRMGEHPRLVYWCPRCQPG